MVRLAKPEKAKSKVSRVEEGFPCRSACVNKEGSRNIIQEKKRIHACRADVNT